MNNSRKTFALLLAVIMMICSIPIVAVAASIGDRALEGSAEYYAPSQNGVNVPKAPGNSGAGFNGLDLERSDATVQTGQKPQPLYQGNAFEGGNTVIGYTRNYFTDDGGYEPYAAWVMYDITDPENTLTELYRGGVEFFEATYDGNLIYGMDLDNRFYSVDPETFESTYIGQCNYTTNDLTYAWDVDKIYGICTADRSYICEFDRTTGRATPIASWDMNNQLLLTPLAYIGNGEFLSLDFNSRKIVKLDLDGNITFLAQSAGEQGWSPSMTYNPNDGLCYLTYTSLANSSVGNSAMLYTVDPETGEMDYKGIIGEQLGYYVLGMFFADFANPEPPVPEGTTLLGYTRNYFTDDGSYEPYTAWVKFSTLDPENTLTELYRGGVEFFEATYDGDLIYGLDIDNNFYSVDPETFESTYIGQCNYTTNDLTYAWDVDKIYGICTADRSYICEFDRTTGRATPIASWDMNNQLLLTPLAYIGNGEFLSLDFNSRKIVKLDLDGNITFLAQSAGEQGWSPSMTYNPNDGLCYLTYTSLANSSVGNSAMLYTVDPETGEMDYKGIIGEQLGYYVLGLFFAEFANGSGSDDPTETLDEALNLEDGLLHFETDEEYPWYVVNFRDEICGTSGNEGKHYTVSEVSTNHYLNAGEMIRFDWRVSCQTGMDFMAFYVNGEQVTTFASDEPGNLMPWTEYIYFVPEAGEYTFSWTYEKTGFWSAGHDRGWLMNVYAGEPIPVETFELNTKDLDIRAGMSSQLEWTIGPAVAYDHSVSFSSQDPSIATVDENGVVTGISVGETVITATTNDGGLSDECVVTITEGLPHVRLYGYRLYSLDGQNDMVSFYADSPSEIESLYTPAHGTYAMAYGNGTIYGFTKEGNFFTTTLEDTEWHLNGYNCGAQIMSMAYNYATDRLYAVGFREQGRWMLYEVNTSSGELTEVGRPNTDDPLWTIEITTEGVAYGITASSGLLYTFDLETAEATLIGPTGCENVNFSQSMAYDHDNKIMYWASYYDNNGLQEVNLETGEATYFSQIGLEAEITGMFVVPSEDPQPVDYSVDAGDVNARQGERVIVPISMENLAAGSFTIEYDAGALTYITYGNPDSAAYVVVNDSIPGILNIAVVNPNQNYNGECMTLEFAVADNAEGTYELALSIDDGSSIIDGITIDIDSAEIAAANGSVSIVTGYNVTFNYMVDGEWISESQTVAVGGTALAPSPMPQAHEVTQYIFTGWDADFSAVQSDLNITAEYGLLGDAYTNNNLDISDAVLIMRSIVGLENLNGLQTLLADVDGSGNVELSDALYVMRLITGLETFAG